jgi:allantoinase
MIEAFDDAGVKPSCTVNGLTITERRRIIDAVNERQWEIVPHNWAQNDLLTYHAQNPDSERAIIRRTLDAYEGAVGRPAKAWLSSAIRGTRRTPAFLKEFGLIAYCDYLNDDQPYMINTTNGPIVAVPYSNDVNDFNMFARGGASTRDGIDMLKACLDQLHLEGGKSGRIMNFGLHPHVIGQPHRIAALKEFLAHAKSIPNVWITNREELATWYMGVHETHIPSNADKRGHDLG